MIGGFLGLKVSWGHGETVIGTGREVFVFPFGFFQRQIMMKMFGVGLSPCILGRTLKHSLLQYREDQEISNQPLDGTPHSLGSI